MPTTFGTSKLVWISSPNNGRRQENAVKKVFGFMGMRSQPNTQPAAEDSRRLETSRAQQNLGLERKRVLHEVGDKDFRLRREIGLARDVLSTVADSTIALDICPKRRVKRGLNNLAVGWIRLAFLPEDLFHARRETLDRPNVDRRFLSRSGNPRRHWHCAGIKPKG